MKLSIFVFLSLFVLIACEDLTTLPRNVAPDEMNCSSGREVRVTIDTPEDSNSRNISEYEVSGTCERDNDEVKLYFESEPVLEFPTCNRGIWETSVDLSGIVNQRERFQIAASQGGGASRCKQVINYFECPAGYVGVPELDNFYGEAFCVMKYEAKVRSESDFNDRFKRSGVILEAKSLASGYLITRVTLQEAIQFCEENGAGYTLISNKQWQTIARHIELTDENWSKDTITIEDGNLLNVGSVSGIKSSSDDSDTKARWSKNKRTHRLPNGEYVWDFAGNLSEIVKHSISSLPVPYDGFIYELPRELEDLFGSERDYSILSDRERINYYGGLGYARIRSFDETIIRGGSRRRDSGIFSVDTSSSRTAARSDIGFRCVFQP